MAFSAITTRGSAVSDTSTTTLAMSPSANLTTGKLVFVSCVSDNDATADGATTFHTVTDSKTNTWVRISERTETDGAANDGVTTSLWGARITNAILTTDSITLTLGSAKTDKIIATFEVTVPDGKTFAVEQVGVGQNSLTASVASLPSREYLLIGTGGAEGEDSAKTASTNYTERFDLVSSTTGNLDVNIALHVQTRIATLTSDSITSAAWTFTNAMQILAAIYEVDVPTGTFPITGILDDFNRANESPLAGGWASIPYWVGDPLHKIVSNQAEPVNATPGFYDALWNTNFNADQEVYLTLGSSIGTLTSIALYCRAINENTGGFTNQYMYVSFTRSTGVATLKVNDGTETTIGTFTLGSALAAGDKIGLQCIGSAIKVFYKRAAGNWFPLIQVTETRHNVGGKVAFNTDASGTYQIDDVGGGNTSASGSRRIFIM